MASSSHHQKQLSLIPRDTHSRGGCITHEMKTSISIEGSKKKETITTKTTHKLRPIIKGNHIALEQEVVNQKKKTVIDKQKLGVREEKHEVREKKIVNCITVEKGKHEVREKKIVNCTKVEKEKKRIPHKHGSGGTLELKFQNFSAGVHVSWINPLQAIYQDVPAVTESPHTLQWSVVVTSQFGKQRERELSLTIISLLAIYLVQYLLWSLKEKKRLSCIMKILKQVCKTLPTNINGGGGRGYQTLGSPPDCVSCTHGSTKTNSLMTSWWWEHVHLSCYISFKVNFLLSEKNLSSNNPTIGRIDANPDLYGPVWVSTTLIFVLASLGNLATYLIEKHTDHKASWSFDVGYVNVAVFSVYGYAIVVPLAFYFLLRYLKSNPKLIQLWCMWGYSLFIFIPSSFLLVIPIEVLRWIIVLAAGIDSAWKSKMNPEDQNVNQREFAWKLYCCGVMVGMACM
ncbi:hypothetical protein OIU85_023685 [Salix viminalis]|uniref:Yip1 domain-containing protein n=1 Tax=Salix viminalis TaxID=40686 RepID=A0A9Q0TZ76_SALVM|nr:hypothetical protein OIU85_023685 [Salix viminalis]